MIMLSQTCLTISACISSNTGTVICVNTVRASSFIKTRTGLTVVDDCSIYVKQIHVI